MSLNEACRSYSASRMAVWATSSLSSLSCERRFLSDRGSRSRICPSSFSSDAILVSTSRRMASGRALNTSGFTTLPSCMGAMAKPVGVRSRAIFWALRLLAQRLQRLLVAGTELLVDGAPPRPGSPRSRSEPAAHCAARRAPRSCPWQGLRAAMRELQRLGAVGSFEVVDIGPIGRRGDSAAFGPRWAFTAVVLPEAGGPSTNKLKS